MKRARLKTPKVVGELFTPESERYISCTLATEEGQVVVTLDQRGTFSCYILRGDGEDDTFVGNGTLTDGLVNNKDSEDEYLKMAAIEAEKFLETRKEEA